MSSKNESLLEGMRTNRRITLRTWFLVVVCSCLAGPLTAQTLPGIPEPGLALYGVIGSTNVAGSNDWSSAVVTWLVTGNNSSSAVTSTIIGVNGQYFYLARIPFETRQLAGTTFGATSNFLALNAAGASYTRSARVNGSSASIAFSSLGHTGSFAFGPGDRGTLERVDLTTNHETFGQWALRFFGTIVVDPSADPDGDGMTNYQEYLAGTNPLDPQSKLALYDVHPDARGGLSISWQTVPGQTYAVFRSGDLTRGFTRLQGALAATATTTSFYDASANGAGPFFYRVGVEPGQP